jgi:hypothetical protein
MMAQQQQKRLTNASVGTATHATIVKLDNIAVHRNAAVTADTLVQTLTHTTLVQLVIEIETIAAFARRQLAIAAANTAAIEFSAAIGDAIAAETRRAIAAAHVAHIQTRATVRHAVAVAWHTRWYRRRLWRWLRL